MTDKIVCRFQQPISLGSLPRVPFAPLISPQPLMFVVFGDSEQIKRFLYPVFHRPKQIRDTCLLN